MEYAILCITSKFKLIYIRIDFTLHLGFGMQLKLLASMCNVRTLLFVCCFTFVLLCNVLLLISLLTICLHIGMDKRNAVREFKKYLYIFYVKLFFHFHLYTNLNLMVYAKPDQEHLLFTRCSLFYRSG